MNRIAYRITLNAPGLPAGHRFDIPADLVPTDSKTTVLEASLAVSRLVQDAIILRINPVYEMESRPPRDTSRRPRQRLAAALSDFLATCKDETLRQQATALKTSLA